MMSDTTDKLCERLLAKEHRGRFTMGGGSVGPDGGKSWGGEKIMELRNPDGPEAAAELTRLTTELAELRYLLADNERLMRSVASRMRDINVCDCFARSEGECACGAWDDAKASSLADELERQADELAALNERNSHEG